MQMSAVMHVVPLSRRKHVQMKEREKKKAKEPVFAYVCDGTANRGKKENSKQIKRRENDSR